MSIIWTTDYKLDITTMQCNAIQRHVSGEPPGEGKEYRTKSYKSGYSNTKYKVYKEKNMLVLMFVRR